MGNPKRYRVPYKIRNTLVSVAIAISATVAIGVAARFTEVNEVVGFFASVNIVITRDAAAGGTTAEVVIVSTCFTITFIAAIIIVLDVAVVVLAAVNFSAQVIVVKAITA